MNELGPVWLTTRREILVRGRSRAFIIGLAVTVLLVVAAVALPRLMGGGGDRYVVGLAGAQSDRLAAVLGAQAEAAEDTELTVVSYPDEAAARAGIESGEVEAAVVDNARLIVAESPGANLRTMLDTAHRIVATEERLRSAGLDPGAVQQAMQVEPLAQVSLSGTSEEEAGTRRMLAMAVVILLFLLIIQACTMVAMGVVEEKGSRIVEILLATIRPAQLLAGKVIGLGVLGLLQIAAIAVAAYAAAQVGGLLPELPEDTPGVLALSVGWFLLGYAFYAVLFAAIASLVSRQEELQSVLTPATLLLMASYFVGDLRGDGARRHGRPGAVDRAPVLRDGHAGAGVRGRGADVGDRPGVRAHAARRTARALARRPGLRAGRAAHRSPGAHRRGAARRVTGTGTGCGPGGRGCDSGGMRPVRPGFDEG